MSLGMASVADLEKRLEELRRELVCIGEMRRGSLTKRYRQCGKPNCHCAQPGDPGHGPSFSLTRQVDGKTVTRIIPAGEAVERTQAQIAEYQRFRGLTRELIEVSERLCQARLKRGEEPVPKTAQKKLPKELPTGSRTRSRETDRRCGRRATGSGSPGDGSAPASAPVGSAEPWRLISMPTAPILTPGTAATVGLRLVMPAAGAVGLACKKRDKSLLAS